MGFGDFDDRWLDVDFTQDPNYVRGALAPSVFADFQDYSAAVPDMSDAEIDAAIDAMDEAGLGADNLVTRIYNQRSEGSCVANAACQGHEVVQAKQFGRANVIPLSAISLYKRIGRSASSGASVSDGLDELRERGVLPLDTPANRARFGEHVMPPTGFRTPYPSGWESTGKLLVVEEAYVIRSVRSLFTALCQQDPVMVGREGHSICYLRPMRDGGRRRVKYANSWGSWGGPGGEFENGFGMDSESQIRKSASWAYAIRSLRAPEAPE